MKQELAKAIADKTMQVSVTGGLSSSFMAYLNVNAAALGLMVSLLGVLVATIFYWLNYRRNIANGINKRHLMANHKRIAELEVIIHGFSKANSKRE